jgi:predicted naringenin-chalcone synthase
MLLDDSRGDMALNIEPEQIQYVTSPKVSELVLKNVKSLVEQVLKSADVRMKDCAVICDPASADIVRGVQKLFALAPAQLESSYAVLKEHGNMSGATVLQIADHLRKSAAMNDYKWAVALSYGPGVGLEAILLKSTGGGAVPTLTRSLSAPLRPACVLSLSSAWPPEKFQYEQTALLEALLAQANLPEDQVEFAKSVYHGTNVSRRALSVPPEKLYTRVKSGAAYKELRTEVLSELFLFLAEAAEGALNEWGGNRAGITHILFGSLSIRMDPNPVIGLIDKLGLSPSVQPISIDHMGCLGGFRILGLASQIAAADTNNRVLCVYGDVSAFLGPFLPDVPNKLDIMSVSLFADGAAAAVVGMEPKPTENVVYEIHAVKSALLKKSRGDMYMKMQSDGTVDNVVTPRVPIFIGKNVEGFVGRVLEGSRLTPQECAVLCHPGGKTILETVEQKLGLAREQTASSWAVLQEHGNMSGATNLQVADHFRKSDNAKKYEWAVCISFGPGLGMKGC